MEKKMVSKKVPIAVGILWIVFVVLVYLAMMVCSIVAPQTYIRITADGWPIMLLGVITSAISVVFMAIIFVLSKKAEIKWLKIVSRIHLLADIGVFLLFGIILLTYL